MKTYGLNLLVEEAIEFAGAEVNNKPCITEKTLMKLFDCSSKEEFVRGHVEPAKVVLDKRGEMWENHIFHVHFLSSNEDFYFFSALAVMVMALNAQKHELYDLMDFAKELNTSFFEDVNDPDRRLKAGDKVEILVENPVRFYPATARISYLGKNGHIIGQEENGDFHVVIDTHIPAVVFSPSSLKRVIE